MASTAVITATAFSPKCQRLGLLSTPAQVTAYPAPERTIEDTCSLRASGWGPSCLSSLAHDAIASAARASATVMWQRRVT